MPAVEDAATKSKAKKVAYQISKVTHAFSVQQSDACIKKKMPAAEDAATKNKACRLQTATWACRQPLRSL